MKSTPHMEYRWNIRAWKQDGSPVLYPVGRIKAEARREARRILDEHPEYSATQVVDGYEELPDDRRYEREPKVVQRTHKATTALKSGVFSASRTEPSGNVADGWIFTFEHEGERYHVEVCAGVIHDDEQDELDNWEG